MEELRKKDRDSLISEIRELRKSTVMKPRIDQVEHFAVQRVFLVSHHHHHHHHYCHHHRHRHHRHNCYCIDVCGDGEYQACGEKRYKYNTKDTNVIYLL